METSFPEILAPELDLIVIGFNPGLRSGETGHHYAGRGNRFWDLLYEAGLTPVRLVPEQDHRLLAYGIGSTNLVARPTPGSGDLAPAEMRAGARELLARLGRLHPRAVAYLGKGVYRAALGAAAAVSYGPAPVSLLPGVLEYVAPNPSGRSAMPWAEKLAWYRRLAVLLGRSGAH